MEIKEMLENYARLEKKREGYHYAGIYDFILKEGNISKSSALTSSEQKMIKKRMRSTNCEFEKKQCFFNSAILTMSDSIGKIKYVEGVVLFNDLPLLIHHAWNEINGAVVDTTLKKIGEYEGLVYMGVEIPNYYVKSEVIRSGYSKSMIDDYENQWPLLKNKFDI